MDTFAGLPYPRLLSRFTARAADSRVFTIEHWQEYIDCSVASDTELRCTKGLRRLSTAVPDYWPVERLGRGRYKVYAGIHQVEVTSEDPEAP